MSIEVQEERSKGVKAEAEEERRNTVYSPKLQIVFVY